MPIIFDFFRLFLAVQSILLTFATVKIVMMKRLSYFIAIAVVSAALLLAACHSDDDTGYAPAVKACVLSGLKADTSALSRSFYTRCDTLSIITPADCDSFYYTLNDIIEEAGCVGKNLEMSVTVRNIIELLGETDDLNQRDTRQLLRLYIHLGSLFTDMGMPTIGSDYYMTGLKYCRDSVYDNYKAMLYNNLGIIYAERDQPKQSEEYFRKALKINLHRNDHQATFISYGNLTELYSILGETEKALETSQLSLDYLDQRSNPDHLANMRIQQGVLYSRIGQYDMALLRFSSALEQYRQLGDAKGIISGYLHIADNFLDWNQPDSAMAYTTEACRLCQLHKRDKDLTGALKTMARIYRMKGQPEKALKLLEKTISMNDSIRNAENLMRMSNWENVTSIMLPDSENSSYKHNWTDILLWIFAAGALTMMTVLYLKLRHSHHQNLSDNAIGKRERELAIDKLNRELTTLSLEKLKLHEGISEICDGLRSVLLELNPRETTKRENIRTQLNRLNSLADYDADEEFKLYFERVHPDFYQKLAALNADLTNRDMRLCALLYLGLNTKEIATITYREIRSVESARNRVRKKLGLDVNDDLTAYLRTVA